MERASLGRTGLEVSVACLGTGGHSRLGQAYGKAFEHSVGVVRAAVDLGVNFIDTAASYGTEEIVGAAVNGRRDSIVLSTKNQIMRPGTSPTGTELIAGAELAELTDASLARLGTDVVDVLYLHGVCAHQYDYSVNELLPALKRLQEAGKARYIAISERPNVDPGHEMLTRAVADGHFDVIMVNLNIVNQTALRQVIPVAQGKRIGIQAMCAVRGPLARMDSARAVVWQAVAAGEIDPADLDPDPLGFHLP
jgi:L-galactose dehydrogenase